MIGRRVDPNDGILVLIVIGLEDITVAIIGKLHSTLPVITELKVTGRLVPDGMFNSGSD